MDWRGALEGVICQKSGWVVDTVWMWIGDGYKMAVKKWTSGRCYKIDVNK